MSEKVINPETGEPVTKQFAEDMGFLDEAEPVDSGENEAVQEIEKDMDEFMEGGGFGDELDDISEGDQIEEAARRLDDIGEDPGEQIHDEQDFFGDTFEDRKPWMEDDARPLYTNNTQPAPEEEEDGEPEIDKREKDWEDTGKTYEETDIGGIRVSE